MIDVGGFSRLLLWNAQSSSDTGPWAYDRIGLLYVQNCQQGHIGAQACYLVATRTNYARTYGYTNQYK